MIGRLGAVALAASLVVACGTYYDAADNYVRGVRFYDRGDFVTAKRWWEPLAQDGDCDAQFRMGFLAMTGRAVEHDSAVVLAWWTRSANQGQPTAQLSLGDVYNPDNSYTRVMCKADCPKDAVIAYEWYLLGERFAGYEVDKRYAMSVLEKIRGQLTPEQRQAGERSATEWQPTPRQCRARVLV
jgi:hypothetical protein